MILSSFTSYNPDLENKNNVFTFTDPDKQMDGAPGSYSNSHLGSYGGHTVSPTEEM